MYSVNDRVSSATVTPAMENHKQGWQQSEGKLKQPKQTKTLNSWFVRSNGNFRKKYFVIFLIKKSKKSRPLCNKAGNSVRAPLSVVTVMLGHCTLDNVHICTIVHPLFTIHDYYSLRTFDIEHCALFPKVHFCINS